MMIHERVLEEEKDAKMYLEMAEEFEAEGHDGAAAILRDIAHEEELHSRHLLQIEKNFVMNL